MVDQFNLRKSLIKFVNDLEQKLLSMKLIEEKFNEFINLLSKTQENIFQDIKSIQTILNQNQFEEDYDEIVQIDGTKSEWQDDDDDDDDDNQDKTITTPSSINDENSYPIKRSSNLKKSSSSSFTNRKSVSFDFDQNRKPIPIFQQFTKETKNILTPTLPFSNQQISNENQFEIDSNLKLSKIIRIHEIESKNGDFIRLLNLSKIDDYDLTEHFLQQTFHSKILCRFHFPSNTILRAGQTITIWCGRDKQIQPNPPDVFLWKEQRKWQTKSSTITILAKLNGQTVACYTNTHRINSDQCSSDILHVHSTISSNSSNSTNVSHRMLSSNRLSTFNLFGNHKPPFAYSPNHPIHPDFHGNNIQFQHQSTNKNHFQHSYSQLINRPKSTPFSSHAASKKDLLAKQLFQTYQHHKN